MVEIVTCDARFGLKVRRGCELRHRALGVTASVVPLIEDGIKVFPCDVPTWRWLFLERCLNTEFMRRHGILRAWDRRWRPQRRRCKGSIDGPRRFGRAGTNLQWYRRWHVHVLVQDVKKVLRVPGKSLDGLAVDRLRPGHDTGTNGLGKTAA